MRCKKVKKELTAFLDGEVSRRLEERMEGHLASCANCRAERKALARIRHAMAGMEPPPMASSVSADAILDRAGFHRGAARASKKRRAEMDVRRFTPSSIMGWRPALALVAGLAVIGFWRAYPFLRSLPPPTEEEIRIAERVDLFEDLELIRDLSLLEGLESLDGRDGELS